MTLTEIQTFTQKALAALRERGWLQDSLEGADGQVCLLGAINLGATGDANNCRGDGFQDEVIDTMGKMAMIISEGEAVGLVNDYASGETDYPYTYDNLMTIVTSWNDDPECNVSEIEELFMRVVAAS